MRQFTSTYNVMVTKSDLGVIQLKVVQLCDNKPFDKGTWFLGHLKRTNLDVGVFTCSLKYTKLLINCLMHL